MLGFYEVHLKKERLYRTQLTCHRQQCVFDFNFFNGNFIWLLFLLLAASFFMVPFFCENDTKVVVVGLFLSLFWFVEFVCPNMTCNEK